MKIKFTQFRWFVTMLLLVTAMAMPKMAWAETYNQNGFAEAGSYQPATLTTGQYDINGDGTKDEVYEIGNAGQLYWFAGLVNGTIEGETQNASANAVLTADITVNTGVLNENGTLNNNGSGLETWTPIGNSDSYTGTFDGQGHTISGLYFNNSENNVVGLFGGNSGTIKNVGVVDSYFYGYDYVGGVCVLNENGTITGCYNTGTVSGNSEVGGVCGHNDGGTITGCYNTGTISGSSYYVGGVCGSNFNGGTITGCYTNNGGVCGYDEGTITDDCGEKSNDEFRDGTVCSLLNTALKNANASVRFYMSGYYPELFMNVPSLVEDVYQISNKEELYAFALLVNKNVETSANAVLTADITVNSGVLKTNGSIADDVSGFRSWTPIGYYDPANNVDYPYSGTFDGNNHTISGLYFNESSIAYVGLFGYSCGTIKNVGVVDSYFNGADFIGGVCGKDDNGTIMNCYNTGTISGNNYVGGVCGENHAEIGDQVATATISNCYNTGTISGNNYVGGVCGENHAEIECSAATATISNCYNTGAINGSWYVGGVCGQNKATSSGEYGDITATITNCFNTGPVNERGANGGGVCGCNEAISSEGPTVTATIENCIYCSDTCKGMWGANSANGGSATSKNVAEKTASQFASGEVAWLLNGSKSESTEESQLVWYQNLSAEGGDIHPVLTKTNSNTVYQVKLYCGGGTVDAGMTYANNTEAVTKEHNMPETASFNSEKKIYEKLCQTKGCGKTVYYANAAGTIEATPNAEETKFTVANYPLQDAKTYDNQAVFTATDFTYTRTFSNTNWTTWYVPFELTLTPEICSKFAFSRINNVHQYDTDNDGNAGKTVVESFRQTAGVTLKANYPYLVKALSESDLNMVLNLTNVKPALAEAESIDCQSVDYKYVFTGTYNEMDESGATLYDPYTLYSDGTWQHYRSLEPMRHYLTISSRNATTSAAAFMRSILLSVIGDEDATGIVKIYDEERRAKETYDLGGRRIPAGSQRNGFYIENGKVIYKK